MKEKHINLCEVNELRFHMKKTIIFSQNLSTINSVIKTLKKEFGLQLSVSKSVREQHKMQQPFTS